MASFRLKKPLEAPTSKRAELNDDSNSLPQSPGRHTEGTESAPVLSVQFGNHTRAYPKHSDGGRANYMPISETLIRTYPFDAHTAGYSYPQIERRLAGDAPQAIPGGVPMVATFFDVDGEGHKADDAWWEFEKPKILSLREETPLFAYRTRGGYRLVGILAETFYITSKADAEAWTQQYLTWAAYLKRVYGITADLACKDWSRLFRLPHATRDEGGKPEDLETIGDPSNIGTWSPDLVEKDYAFAALLEKKEPSNNSSRPTWHPRAVTFGSGEGVLFRLFQSRGWVGEELETGKWTAICPWSDSHSKGAILDSSTILWAPRQGEEWGWFYCAHSHCAGHGLREVLAIFSPAEIDAARFRSFLKVRVL